jgi:hypothetical protein
MQKTAKNVIQFGRLADFPNQELVPNPKPRLGTFTAPGASKRSNPTEE